MTSFRSHCPLLMTGLVITNIQQLHEDQVAMVTRMVGYEEKVCHCVSAYLFSIPFSTIFIAQLAPLSLLSPYASLCLPILPYMISTISMFFPTMRTPTLLSLSFSSQPFTRYQEQDLLVVNFGLLRAISTISTIPTIPTISLPPPKLLYDLSQCSLQPHEHLANSLEIANSLLQHLNLKSYW